jgi:hypothetical protein
MRGGKRQSFEARNMGDNLGEKRVRKWGMGRIDD